MYLHKLAKFVTSKDFQRDILQFNRGMKRKVTKEKNKLGHRLEEGKKGIIIEVYKLMLLKLIGMETEDSVIAHLFLILK